MTLSPSARPARFGDLEGPFRPYAPRALLDTIDGSIMNFAYGWAFSKPVRKVFYNIAITGLSVIVALMIGTIKLAGLFASKLEAQESFWE